MEESGIRSACNGGCLLKWKAGTLGEAFVMVIANTVSESPGLATFTAFEWILVKDNVQGDRSLILRNDECM
jgi:hypothetical protein